jgi:exonuclease SbcC
MLQSTTRTQLDQLKGALSGFEAISKETILALEIEVVEGRNYKKENRVCWQNRTQQLTTLKVNFEDLEKRKPAFDFN